MNVVGIICEYNPFHNGHAYQIAQTRARLGADCAVVAVMSGNFVQRGEYAVMGKYARAACAVDCGADLVLDAHRDFGGETVQRAVERRLERHTVLVHEREPLLAFRDHVVRFHAGDVHGERLLEARAE